MGKYKEAKNIINLFLNFFFTAQPFLNFFLPDRSFWSTNKKVFGAFKSVVTSIYLYVMDFTLLYIARQAFSEGFIIRLFLKGRGITDEKKSND